MRKKLNSVFYIYNGASLAVFALIGAAVELACGVGLQYYHNPIATIAYVAAAVFLAAALLTGLSVYRAARRDGIL